MSSTLEGSETTLAEAVIRLLGQRHQALADERKRVAKEWTPESIHDLRVACRRFRSTLKSFQPLLAPEPTKALAAELKAFMQAFNELRDVDVQLEQLAACRIPVPLHQKREVGEIARQLEERKATLDAKLQKFVRETSAREALPLPTPIVAPEVPVQAGPRELLTPELINLSQRFRAVKWHEPEASVEPLHELRIAFKRLRYGVELFAPVLGPASDGLLKLLKRFQDLLGWIHDGDVFSATLSRFLRKRFKERGRCIAESIRALGWPTPRLRDTERRIRQLQENPTPAYFSLIRQVAALRARRFREARDQLNRLDRRGWLFELQAWFQTGISSPTLRKELRTGNA